MATPAGKTGAHDSMKDAILSRIREDEIVAMCCDVINIPSPTGGELAMAEYMRAAFQQLGLTITWQQVEDARANVVGRLEGAATANASCSTATWTRRIPAMKISSPASATSPTPW